MGKLRDYLEEARNKQVPTEFRIALGQLKRMYNTGEVPEKKELEKDVEMIANKNHLDVDKFLEFVIAEFKLNESEKMVNAIKKLLPAGDLHVGKIGKNKEYVWTFNDNSFIRVTSDGDDRVEYYAKGGEYINTFTTIKQIQKYLDQAGLLSEATKSDNEKLIFQIENQSLLYDDYRYAKNENDFKSRILKHKEYLSGKWVKKGDEVNLDNINWKLVYNNIEMLSEATKSKEDLIKYYEKNLKNVEKEYSTDSRKQEYIDYAKGQLAAVKKDGNAGLIKFLKDWNMNEGVLKFKVGDIVNLDVNSIENSEYVNQFPGKNVPKSVKIISPKINVNGDFTFEVPKYKGKEAILPKKFILESAVGKPGRTTEKDAEDHIDDELVAEFRKIIKKLGGKTVAKVLLDKLGQKAEIKDEIDHIEDMIDNSNY